MGDRLTISTPNNLFALIPSARKHLFIAGGIGITPFLSHMAELQHSDVDWQLRYCSRNPESCAFRDELVQHPQAESSLASLINRNTTGISAIIGGYRTWHTRLYLWSRGAK